MMGSMMARSTTWPAPVRSRAWIASSTPYAVASAVTESASPNGGSVGGPSGSPVAAANPLIASARVPKPGRRAYGPTWPNPVMRAITSRGLTACSSSGPSPQRSRVPGRKFSTSTSASASIRRRTAAPASCDRSRVTVRLLRPSTFHHSPTPSLSGPCPRAGSGRRGCSTFTTSAPKSARNAAASGPANSVAVSTTRIPSSGAVTARPASGRRRSGTRSRASGPGRRRG